MKAHLLYPDRDFDFGAPLPPGHEQTGIILSAFALAAQSGRPASVVGAALLTAGFTLKARFEEGLLSAQLGEQAYGAYRRRTPMLVPFLK